MPSSPFLWITGLIAVLGFALAACTAEAVIPTPPVILETEALTDALQRDAEYMAADLGITVEDATTRLQSQGAIGELNAALAERERDNFSGLWIEQTPEYRVVVAFTRDGQETIKPYIVNTAFESTIQVERAEVTLAELETIQQTVMHLLQAFSPAYHTATNIPENRVEIYVADADKWGADLSSIGQDLPEHVVVVETK